MRLARVRALIFLSACVLALVLLLTSRFFVVARRDTDSLSDPAPNPLLLASYLRRNFCAPPGSRDHLDYTALAWLQASRLLNGGERDAALEAGERASVHGDEALASAEFSAMSAFYSFHAGVALLQPGGGAPRCAYHRIFKANNMKTMNEIDAWNNGTTRILTPDEFFTEFAPAQIDVHSFTWGRAPLDRFLSGYGEILYRAMPDTVAYSDRLELRKEARSPERRAAGVTFLHLPPGDRDRFATFLRNLVAGAPIFEVEHVYSAAPVFFAAQRAGVGIAVGRLEAPSHHADVRHIHARCGVAAAGVQGHSYGASLRDTPVGQDIADARSALSKAGTPILDALCLLLLPDFSCTGYLPPAGCRSVLQKFTEHVEQVRDKRRQRSGSRRMDEAWRARDMWR